MRATTLISTVGTSLFFPNLAGLKTTDENPETAALAKAYSERDLPAISTMLAGRLATERLCGAEINSIASLSGNGLIEPGCNLLFCHSDTEDGRAIGEILVDVYRQRGHAVVERHQIDDLQDTDPRRFRTSGLRNLIKILCRLLRERHAPACAINATGGYKAQIAIAVMVGQALGIPVYYKHERFDEIIAFPPMPVALDFEVWMRVSGVLFQLDRAKDLPAADFAGAIDEKLESLIERVSIDGAEYLELSPAGQLFHELFRDRFRAHADQVLPPAVPVAQKRPPHWEAGGHMRQHPEVLRFMEELTAQIPQVVHCRTWYFNPDLSAATHFRLSAKGIDGVFSKGPWTVKFAVETSAQTEGQKGAVVARMNEWLAAR